MAIKILSSTSTSPKPYRWVRDLIKAGDDPERVSNFNFRTADEVIYYIKDLLNKTNDDALKLKKLRHVFSAYKKFMPSLAKVKVEAELPGMKVLRIDRHAPIEQKKLKPKYNAGGPVKVDELSIPNPQKFKENFDLLKSLQSKMDVLDTLESQVAQEFQNERTPLLSEIKRAREKIFKVYKATLAFIGKGVEKKQPAMFQHIVDDVMAPVLTALEGNYSQMQESILLTLQGDDSEDSYYVFNRYYLFADLDNGDGFVYPEYVIVFTAVVSQVLVMNLYVNVLHRFRTPGHFKFGLSFADVKSGKHELDALLEADSMVDVLESQKMPSDKLQGIHEKFTAKQYIKDFRIDGDNIVIDLYKVTNANLDEVTKALLGDVRTALSFALKGKSLKYKREKSGQGKYTFTFKMTLQPSEQMREKGLNPQRIKILRDKFGADDNDIHSIEQVLMKGYDENTKNPWLLGDSEEEEDWNA